MSTRTGPGGAPPRAPPPPRRCRRAVRNLLRPHGFKYGTATAVAHRESAEVLVQVPFHLALRLEDEAETRPVARQRRERTDGEGAGIPERIEEARPCAELCKAGLAPRQMIVFRARGFIEQGARGRGT